MGSTKLQEPPPAYLFRAHIRNIIESVDSITGVGTLEISGGIYNTAGFLQGDSWRKDTNIITSKTQALGSLA